MGVSALVGSAAFAAPNGFNDDNFYRCVIDSYFDGVSIQPNGGTTVLTPEQLASMTELDCRDYRITDITGIEKLTNLETVSLNDNEIEEADLSKNTKLETIDLNSNLLTSVILPASAKTVHLFDNDSTAMELDTSAATNLTLLDIHDAKFLGRILDLSKNTKLETLHADGTNLKSINLYGLKRLQTVQTVSTSVQGGTATTTIDGPVLILNTNYKAVEDTTNNASGAALTSIRHELNLGDYITPEGFIPRDEFLTDVDSNDNYRFDANYGKLAISGNTDSIKGFVQLAGYNIYVPINDPGYADDYNNPTIGDRPDGGTIGDDNEGEGVDVPSTSTGPTEEKKDNPNTSTASKLILGFSFLGAAAVAMAIKAVIKARAKRA